MKKNEVHEDELKSSSFLKIKTEIINKDPSDDNDNEELYLLNYNRNEIKIKGVKDGYSKQKFNNDYNTFSEQKNGNNCDNICDKNTTLNQHQLNMNDKSTLDKYLDSVGYNSFQLFIIFIVCYVFFVDGSEMVLINLILSSIQRDWKISIFERSILSSAVFFGFFFGSFISGYLTNKYGRKKPTLFGVFLIWGFTTFAPFIHSFLVLFTLRLFVGVGIGFVVPSLTSLVTELIPTFYRSFVLNMLWIFYPLGIIYICVVSIFHIKDKEFLDWRAICKINSYSSIIMVILTFFLCESPRYLLIKRKYEEAFLILDKVGKSKNIKLSMDEKEKIILESQLLEECNKNKGDFDIKTFCEKNFLRVSLLLCYLWFITSLISYGLLYILPKIFDSLSKHDKYNSLIHMIYSMLILTPSPFFRGIISEIKSLGRKKSMILGFTGAGISCMFCIFNQSYISFSSGLLKFFINSSLGIVSVYTSEVYPTNVRTIALGFGNSITRLGGILTPFICELVESFLPKGPFWLFIISSFTGIIACVALPYETMGMVLDKIPNDKLKYEYKIKNEQPKNN